MDFEDSSEEIEEEGITRSDSLDPETSEGEEYTESDEEIGEIEKDKHNSKHSLEVRRAIEDHLERTRLRKELDYLYDDDFSTDEADDKNEE